MALTINLWTKTMPACTEQVLHTRISVSYDRCRAFCTINITWMSEKKNNVPHQGSFMHWTTSRTQMTSVSGQIGSRQDKFDVFKILIQHLCLKRIIFKSYVEFESHKNFQSLLIISPIKQKRYIFS